MWNDLLNIFSFTGITSVNVWQAVVMNSIIIPIVLLTSRSLWVWFDKKKPLQSLLSDYLTEDAAVLIFLTQLSGAFDDWRFNPNQKYIVRYPDPIPTDRNRLGAEKRQNVDPVWSEGDGECLADVYNVMGKAGRIKGIKIGHTVKHWEEWTSPSVSIGFSPKTHKFIEKCAPIYFDLINNSTLRIRDSNIELGSRLPNDAGIIQKTYVMNCGNPVLILAGLGTMGTSAAGHFLANNCVDIGKMYGSKSFCILVKVRTDQGRASAIACASYPKPSWYRILLYPAAYQRFRKQMKV